MLDQTELNMSFSSLLHSGEQLLGAIPGQLSLGFFLPPDSLALTMERVLLRRAGDPPERYYAIPRAAIRNVAWNNISGRMAFTLKSEVLSFNYRRGWEDAAKKMLKAFQELPALAEPTDNPVTQKQQVQLVSDLVALKLFQTGEQTLKDIQQTFPAAASVPEVNEARVALRAARLSSRVGAGIFLASALLYAWFAQLGRVTMDTTTLILSLVIVGGLWLQPYKWRGLTVVMVFLNTIVLVMNALSLHDTPLIIAAWLTILAGVGLLMIGYPRRPRFLIGFALSVLGMVGAVVLGLF